MKHRKTLKNNLPIVPWLTASAVLLGCYGILAVLPNLPIAVPEMLAMTAGVVIFLAATIYFQEKTGSDCPPIVILIGAAVFRLLFLFHAPQLSDDIYRYLFDGTQLLAGHNPYAESPELSVIQNGLAADIVAKVNHPHLVTIYPPAAQLIFAAGTLWGGLVGMKAVLIGMDMLLIALMLHLAATLAVPRRRIILYAWHPLPILEIASSGHIDGAGLMVLFGVICLITLKTNFSDQRIPSQGPPFCSKPIVTLLCGVLFAIAVFIKLFPIVYFPLFFYLLCTRRFAVFLLGMVAGGLLLVVPFYPGIANILSTLRTYAASWEFSGLAFRTLRNWGLPGFLARGVLSFGFLALLLFCYRSFARFRKSGAPKQTMLKKLLTGHYVIGVGFLLFTPTLHPWYGLYMLSFLPFVPNATGLILSWSITLGYRVLISYSVSGQWIENDMVPFLIWIGPVAAFLLPWAFRKTSLSLKHKSDGPRRPNSRILSV